MLADCTIAALAKMIEQRCLLNNVRCELTLEHVHAAYSKATGWSPKDPTTDRGGQMRDAIRVAMTDGIGPYKFDAVGRVNVRDPIELRAALWAFGSIYVGGDLPKRVLEQKDVWVIPAQMDARDRVRSLGGHAFLITGAEHMRYHALPWVHAVTFDERWARSYIDEGYVLMDSLWASQAAFAPNGFDYERLLRDLKAIDRLDLPNPFF